MNHTHVNFKHIFKFYFLTTFDNGHIISSKIYLGFKWTQHFLMKHSHNENNKWWLEFQVIIRIQKGVKKKNIYIKISTTLNLTYKYFGIYKN